MLTIRPRNNKPLAITELAEAIQAEITGSKLTEAEVTGLTIDSRDVRPGDLYVGMPGANQHGIDYAVAAKKLGAAALLTDAGGYEKLLTSGSELELPVLVINENPRRVLGEVASLVYRTDKTGMQFFGVTGTNGKTSVIYMLEALMRLLEIKTGISTTAERRIGQTAIESNLTSPEASELHGLVARMAEEGVQGVGIEVSAQAVKRNRLDGLLFDVVAFNNFSQDHLDEFGDMETYFQSKLGLFSPAHAKKAVVVVDSVAGQRIARESKIPVTTLSTEYGVTADWHLAITNHTIDGVSFVLQGPNDSYFRARVPLFGRFMAENAALALIMLHEAGNDLGVLANKLKTEQIPVHIPGRLELINCSSKGPRFYVDYGHTPGSFASMLDALDEVCEGKIIFMFGADGDRDTTKREEMGRIASAGADVLIICDYHPRFEDPQKIRTQLIMGAESARYPAEIHEIPDPRKAIRFAIDKAQPEDIIVYAGPGHESYQEVAGNMIAYSARDEVRKALTEAGLQ